MQLLAQLTAQEVVAEADSKRNMGNGMKAVIVAAILQSPDYRKKQDMPALLVHRRNYFPRLQFSQRDSVSDGLGPDFAAHNLQHARG